jgi:PhzF family phenazine biosynthesis protein
MVVDSQVELEINVVDAFTGVVFKGNSAAVIITKDWLSDEIMQSIAIENNLSEPRMLKNCISSKSLGIRQQSASVITYN